MLINKNGNILESKENLICHQVNEDGVMGGGLAKQIANSYPQIEKNYKRFCIDFSRTNIYGHYQLCPIKENKYIVNCFTQRNFETNLNDITRVFSKLLELCKKRNFTIAIPYKYGCGIANGDWEEVSKVFEDLSIKHEVDINVYKLKD